MEDLHSELLAVAAIGPAVLAASTTSQPIDRQGFDSAEIVIAAGVGGITFSATNKIDFRVTHSDDNATYSDVTDEDMIGVTGIAGGIVKTLDTSHPAATVSRFGYIGNKRYTKVEAVFSGTHGTGTPIAVTWLNGDPEVGPTDDQA